MENDYTDYDFDQYADAQAEIDYQEMKDTQAENDNEWNLLKNEIKAFILNR